MVASIPERLRSALTDFAIGIGTRDAYRVVRAYADAGILLPGVNLPRLEEATADMILRLWGVRMGKVRDLAAGELKYFLQEYRDIVYEAPFQFPVELLFTFRAIGILSGMTTNLDGDFDPWRETVPFAERLAKNELEKSWHGWLKEGFNLGRLALKLPTQLNRVLTAIERGDHTFRTSLAPDTRKSIQMLERSVNRLTSVVLGVGLIVTGVNLEISHGGEGPGAWIVGAAVIILVFGVLKG